MNSLKQLFGKIKLPKVRVETTMSKANRDISEPIYAIVETMRKYPSRFKLKTETGQEKPTRYIVKDTKTNQIIVAIREMAIWDDDYNIVDWHYSLSWEWLTKDECDFLVSEFKATQETKKLRKHSISRAKFKGLYK